MFNPKNDCDQSKAVSIIYEDRLSPCFDEIKIINEAEVKKIITLLRSAKTYGSEDLACFDTDYALVIYDHSSAITGYVNISFSCNKLISNPVILERERGSAGGLRKVGFSKYGKSQLVRLLDLK